MVASEGPQPTSFFGLESERLLGDVIAVISSSGCSAVEGCQSGNLDSV